MNEEKIWERFNNFWNGFAVDDPDISLTCPEVVLRISKYLSKIAKTNGYFYIRDYDEETRKYLRRHIDEKGTKLVIPIKIVDSRQDCYVEVPIGKYLKQIREAVKPILKELHKEIVKAIIKKKKQEEYINPLLEKIKTTLECDCDC